MDRKFLVNFLLIASLCVLLVIVLFFLFRGSMLDYALSKAGKKLEEETGLNLSIEASRFEKLASITLYGIRVYRKGEADLFYADTLRFEPSLSELITGGVRIKSFYVSNSILNITCLDGKCNYSRPAKVKSSTDKQAESGKSNYASLLNRLLRRAFNLAPQKAGIRNFRIELSNDSLQEKLRIPYYQSGLKELEGILEDEKTGLQWKLSGNFSQRKETFDLTIYPLTGIKQHLPVLNGLTGTDCSFDTVHLALSDLRYANGMMDLKGHFSAHDLQFFHKKVSQDTVRLKRFYFDPVIRVSSSAVQLDSATTFRLNSILARPFCRIERKKSTVIDLKIRTEPTEATDFYYSLPEGMFDVVRDIEGHGTLEYSLDFRFDTASPDSLIFESAMKKHRFRLSGFGNSNLRKLNTEFMHEVYENDRLFRVFQVGPSNPSFTVLDSISSFFRSAVLTSEDGNFFHHRGFNEEAFRKSIATNYKAGKFQRGGSTISMQLVKNVFLTRKKTISRKAEEALIVWLIENNRLVSKERMFEVYLNIIELGPGIYGIGEAARFYFAKHPSELDLAESIFLASLLPHPKWFRSSFDESGNLKPHLESYYRIVSNFMLKKELITEEQFEQLKPSVMLNGPARELVVKNDSIPADIERSKE